MRLFLLLLFLSSACYAQEYNKIKIGFAAGFPLTWPASNSSTNTPVILNFEPSYRLNDKLAVGVRMEAAFRDNGSIRSNGIFSQYYLSNNKFRPFVGLGVGFFRPSNSFYLNSESYYTDSEETKFGFYPRVGFDFGHLTLTMDYNVAGVSRVTLNNQSRGTARYSELKSDYLSIKLGFFSVAAGMLLANNSLTFASFDLIGLPTKTKGIQFMLSRAN